MRGPRIGRRAAILTPWICLCAVAPLMAQTSTHYKLSESSINASGDPKNGVVLTGPQFHMTLDSVGGSIVRPALTSSSFHMDEGYAGSYAPPGEVRNLQFANEVAVLWDAERSSIRYQVYRGVLSSMVGAFGTCLAGNLFGQLTSDPSDPPLGQSFFYLITGRNRLGEEGPKGYGSSGALEPNPAPCP